MIPAQPKVLLALDAHEKSRQQAYVDGRVEDYFYHSMCIERLKREAKELARRAQR